MGVLDDAIRQHLELKRAHGADESEVQRKENEALGPARREAAPAPAPEPELAPEQPLAAEETPAPVYEEQDPVANRDESVALEESADGAPVEDPLAEPPPPAPGGTETDDEDVLEETPDFLQETPEHDRLWFEQKPPRDFDFDE